MGIIHSIEALLDLKYEISNIDYLFQKCLENNIGLYSDAFYDIYKLDSQAATKRILSLNLEFEDRSARAKFQDTGFSIAVYKAKNNLLKFTISNFGITWRKEFLMIVMVLILHDMFVCYLEFVRIFLFLH